MVIVESVVLSKEMMADNTDMRKTRCMTEKEQGATQSEEGVQSTSRGTSRTQPTSDKTAALTPTGNLHRVEDNFIQPEQDSVDCFLRHSSKKVKKFWCVPDLKNNRLRDILEVRLPHEHDPTKILFNAPELRRFFPTSTFEICLGTGRVYAFTDPKNDIGIGCEPDPFDLEELENHFTNQTKTMDNGGHTSHGKNPIDRKNHSSYRSDATQRIRREHPFIQ